MPRISGAIRRASPSWATVPAAALRRWLRYARVMRAARVWWRRFSSIPSSIRPRGWSRGNSSGRGTWITATGLDWFWEQYLGSPADTRNALAAPAKAGSLAGLPPALVLTTEYEVSRDEAEAYAKRLADSGVETDCIRFDGLIHGVYWMSGAVPRSGDLRDAVTRFLSKRFA